MTRRSACGARDSRQLDFFTFSPVVRPVDRSPPPGPQALPLRVVPALVLRVIELPEIHVEPEPPPPAATAISKASRFTITDADRLGEGSMRQKCEANLRHSPFEAAKLADDFFDRRFPRFLIHDYCFAASIARVRPGGLVAFVTSRGTLDGQDAKLREFVDRQADLLGATVLLRFLRQCGGSRVKTPETVSLRGHSFAGDR